MERRRIRSVVVLLAVVVLGQSLTVAARRVESDGEAPAVIPAGAEPVVSDTLLAEGRVLRATVSPDSFSPPAHTLYGESGVDDPFEGRLLAVGSAFSEGGNVLPTSEIGGFRVAELGGRSVAVGHDRAWTWVTWTLPNCTAVCQGYAAGRNLSEQEVLEAARGATADRSAPAAATVPAGMQVLVTARLDLRDFGAPTSQLVSWLWKGDPVAFRVTPGVDVATLMRFWVDGGTEEVRDRSAAVGEIARVGFGGDLVGRAWAESGRSFLVLTTRLLVDDVDRFVAGLRGARAGEWEALRARVLDVSNGIVTRGCDAAGGSFTAVGREEGRYRWGVAFGAGRGVACNVILTPDRVSLGLGGFTRPPPRAVSVTTTAIGGATDPVGLFVLGVAPAGTDRVRLDVADGRRVEAEMSATGPAPGERYYAGFVEGTVRVRPTVVALSGAGAEVARAPGGAPA